MSDWEEFKKFFKLQVPSAETHSQTDHFPTPDVSEYEEASSEISSNVCVSNESPKGFPKVAIIVAICGIFLFRKLRF